MLSSLLFIGIIAVLLGYIFHIKKELKHIATQLHDYNNKDMDTTISISLVDNEITLLAKNINIMILENKKTHIAILKHEENLKNSVVNISHDLRTPLISIIGYLQILQKEQPSDNQLDYINTLLIKAKQLKKLIDTFYELSIIELHSRPLIPKKIDVSRLLKETLLLYLEDFNQKEITVHLNISDSVFLVADKNHLTQIIINLIDNAIKYAINYFSVELYEENAHSLLLFSNETVPNTKLDIEHVTDKFYTGNLSRTDEATGVGLYMVEQLIFQLGGTLSIHFKNNMFLVKIIL